MDDSTGGTLSLTQNASQVSGTNCCRPGHPNYSGDVSGTFDGKNYVGIFHFKDGDKQGTGTFIYVLNRNQLEGSFKVIGGEETESVLTRVAATGSMNPTATPPAPPASPPTQVASTVDAPAKPAPPPVAATPAAPTPQSAPPRQATPPTCHTEPVHVRFSDNPSVSSKQTTSGGGVCNLSYTTGSPGTAVIIAMPGHGALTQVPSRSNSAIDRPAVSKVRTSTP